MYGDCAAYIRPLKSRKYIKDMLTCISVGIEGKEEGIFETIAVMLERVCPSLIFYLREREVQGMIELFRYESECMCGVSLLSLKRKPLMKD